MDRVGVMLVGHTVGSHTGLGLGDREVVLVVVGSPRKSIAALVGGRLTARNTISVDFINIIIK
jgi:hypothetical protein